ncbi:MAG: two-component system, sensor histidine kinase and response regulator [Abditibacteriota bacterium]|jgi:CheY-like chemotaxis protein|nr:two-component system, sensor histidine kinase and response regulator [Abditibacteriota bacterium]
MHILFVDDTKDTREMYAYFFGLKGFETETAANGAEAIAAVQHSEEPFDAVVLDIEMPIMNGWEALDAIRKMPQCQNLPIIMFSAYAEAELQTRAIEAGANGLLHKPLLPHDMIQAVAELCAVKRVRPDDTHSDTGTPSYDY